MKRMLKVLIALMATASAPALMAAVGDEFTCTLAFTSPQHPPINSSATLAAVRVPEGLQPNPASGELPIRITRASAEIFVQSRNVEAGLTLEYKHAVQTDLAGVALQAAQHVCLKPFISVDNQANITACAEAPASFDPIPFTWRAVGLVGGVPLFDSSHPYTASLETATGDSVTVECRHVRTLP